MVYNHAPKFTRTVCIINILCAQYIDAKDVFFRLTLIDLPIADMHPISKLVRASVPEMMF